MKPLATRLRPKSISQYVGQTHLLATGKPLHQCLHGKNLHSMILWGPPGTGKTTLAKILAEQANLEFVQLSAVLCGVKDIRKLVESTEHAKQQIILFIDEIHRFNKAQQDAFLPLIEDGTIILIGATTENPSFELNNALLSRCKVYVLKSLSDEELDQILTQALNDKSQGYGDREYDFSTSLRHSFIQAADGDARQLLQNLEVLLTLVDDEPTITTTHLEQALTKSLARYDKQGEYFYDQISALHKSLRGSDPNAALYWFCRMLQAGCDPMYIARRLVRFASEDIGNADPRALNLALDAVNAFERLGSPEGELAIAQAVIYLACAPKSNACYQAFKQAQRFCEQTGSAEVPMHLRNAVTKLMTSLEYGKSYRYAHDEPHGYAAGENYFPSELTPQQFYKPNPRGLEIKILEKLQFLADLDKAAKNGDKMPS